MRFNFSVNPCGDLLIVSSDLLVKAMDVLIELCSLGQEVLDEGIITLYRVELVTNHVSAFVIDQLLELTAREGITTQRRSRPLGIGSSVLGP